MASAPVQNVAKRQVYDFVSLQNNLVEKCLYFSIGPRENSTMGVREKASLGTRNVDESCLGQSVKQKKNYPKYSFGEFFSFEIFFGSKTCLRENETVFAKCTRAREIERFQSRVGVQLSTSFHVALCCSTSTIDAF